MTTSRKVTLIFLALVGAVVAIASAGSGVPAAVWSLRGNRGSDPAADYLGTSDDQPLIVKTNSATVLTLGTGGPVEVHKALVVHGDTTIDSNVNVGSELRVAGGVTFSGPLALTGNADIGGDLSVAGQAQFSHDAHVHGNLTADGVASVGGVTLHAGGLYAGSLELSGNASVSGTTRTGVLEITGGDLAEPFTVSAPNAFPAGALVVIDDKHEGLLTLSKRPYDRRVAGVVSGAGGISPGVIMYRNGAGSVSQHVALAGRVYALADASNGSIKPGDLLTSSTIPGHVMKVVDQRRAQGAVIGKAMSSLHSGTGLVLTLVNLQ